MLFVCFGNAQDVVDILNTQGWKSVALARVSDSPTALVEVNTTRKTGHCVKNHVGPNEKPRNHARCTGAKDAGPLAVHRKFKNTLSQQVGSFLVTILFMVSFAPDAAIVCGR